MRLQMGKGKAAALLLFSGLAIPFTCAASDSILGKIAKLALSMAGLPSVYENITTDPGVLGRFWEAQTYHATLNDTSFPTNIFLNLSPNSPTRFALRKCERKDVGQCLYRGNSSNGLPKVLQGIWWQDGIKFDEEVISAAGPWDPVKRQLNIPTWSERNWGSHDDGSVKDPSGLFWLPGGAGHMNWLISWRGIVQIVLNKELTFGQCYATATLFTYFPIAIPPFLFNWTMSLQPDGSWLRKTVTLGIPTPSGDYTLRNIITGEGEKGPYFDAWVKDRDGRPFIYADRIVD